MIISTSVLPFTYDTKILQCHGLIAPDERAWICAPSIKGFVSKLFFDDSAKRCKGEKLLTPLDSLCFIHLFDV